MYSRTARCRIAVVVLVLLVVPFLLGTTAPPRGGTAGSATAPSVEVLSCDQAPVPLKVALAKTDKWPWSKKTHVQHRIRGRPTWTGWTRPDSVQIHHDGQWRSGTVSARHNFFGWYTVKFSQWFPVKRTYWERASFPDELGYLHTRNVYVGRPPVGNWYTAKQWDTNR